MDLNIIPDPAIDLTRLGVCKTFDTKASPGFVLCIFENGQQLSLLAEMFDQCRFMIAEDAKANKQPLLGFNSDKTKVHYTNTKHMVAVR